MFLSKFSKKIREIFTPCTIKLKMALDEHNRVCLDAQCRVDEKTRELMTALGVSKMPEPKTKFPQFAPLVHDLEFRRVRNPR